MYKIINLYVKGLFLLTIFICPFMAFAASQGTTGATSSGSVAINLYVPSLVRISNLSDMAFTLPNLSGNEKVCVFSNNSSHKYKITATGDGAGSAFTLKGKVNTTSTAAYSVVWYDSINKGGAKYTLTTNTAQDNISNGSSDTDCNTEGGSNASFDVVMDSTANSLTPDQYLGTLTLLVAPAST